MATSLGRQSEAVRELAQVTRKLESRVDAIADGLRAPGLHRKHDELEGRKVDLEQAVAAPSPAVLLHPNLAARVSPQRPPPERTAAGRAPS